MFTSFAPSPIESVIFCENLFLIKFTISAFYFGDTLQANTTSTVSDACKNFYFNSSLFSITTIEAPPTIIAYWSPFGAAAIF